MIQEIIDKIEWEIELRKNMPHNHEQVDICYGLNRAKDIVSTMTDIKWIPVAERLPEIEVPVLITLWDKDVTIGTWYGHRWGTALCYNEDVLAWMPLPEPYKPEALREAGAEAGQDAAEQVLQSAT